MNMLVFVTTDQNDPQIEINRQHAEAHGALFYACNNYQEVW